MEDRYVFRGKRTDNGEWVQGCLITDETEDSKRFIGYVIGTDEDGIPHDLDVVQVDPSTICKYYDEDKTNALNEMAKYVNKNGFSITEKDGRFSIADVILRKRKPTGEIIEETSYYKLFNTVTGKLLGGEV